MSVIMSDPTANASFPELVATTPSGPNSPRSEPVSLHAASWVQRTTHVAKRFSCLSV